MTPAEPRRLDTPAIKALEAELKAESEAAIKAAREFTERCDKADAKKPTSRRYKLRNKNGTH